MPNNSELIDLTTEIVSAYVANNSTPRDAVPDLIQQIYRALADIAEDDSDTRNRLTPAVPVSESVTDDYIICLEDGQKFQSLKRHLRSHFDLSPDDYRAKWDLPKDYPMVAPNYTQRRSILAKEMGLGQTRSRRKGS